MEKENVLPYHLQMEQSKTRQHAITEIEAEISEMRSAPAPEGRSKRATRERADYYKQILDLYAEKEQLLQKSAREMRERRAKSSESKLKKITGWG